MYFDIAEDGRLMICAQEEAKPGMVRIDPPEDFDPDEMHRWKLKDGALIRDPDYTEPPRPITADERISALEEALELLLSGVTE